MTDVEQHDSVQVFVGVDVGKERIMPSHWIVRENVFSTALCPMTRRS